MSVDYEVKDGTAWITLNRPEKLNALTIDGWRGITEGLRRAARDSNGPVVITGAGRAFCAGDDIAVFEPLTRDRVAAQEFFLDVLYGTFEAIVTHPTPVIAAVNGAAFGGGLELVATSDLAISSDSATFGIPEGKLGTIPAVFVALAPTHFSFKAANAFAYRMAAYTAEEARSLGIVNDVVAPAALLPTVEQRIAEINSASPEAVRWTKRFLTTDARAKALPRIKAALQASIDDLLGTDNLKEGTDAFLTKRRPVFRGR